MVFRHGKNAAGLFGGYDLTQWITDASVPVEFDTTDTSHWGTQAKTYIPGMQQATATVNGLFDSDPTALENKIAAFTADTANPPITICPDGGAIVGRRAQMGRALRTNYDLTAQISDVVKFSGAFQFTGMAANGYILAPNTATATTTNYATVDNGAASTLGAVAFFHVIANSNAANTVKVQHSTDNATWVDLQTAQAMPVITTTPTYYVVTATGTINRYLRAVVTISSGSATVAVSAYRN